MPIFAPIPRISDNSLNEYNKPNKQCKTNFKIGASSSKKPRKRHCLTDDESFDNAFRLGMVYGYIHSALKMLIEKKELPKDRLEVAVTATENLKNNRSYQGIVDTLNKLMDSHIIY